jgi:hypothetical protein
VGAPESATFDTTAPRRIDGDGSVALVEAAAAAGVKQFVLVTSLGTGKFGFPAAVLNLFWGVLNEKRKAEEVRVLYFEGQGEHWGGRRDMMWWSWLWAGCATGVVGDGAGRGEFSVHPDLMLVFQHS